jgi:hypothetical protein
MGCEYLVDLFWRISARRQSGPNGPQTISHGDFEAALKRFRASLEDWELDALDAMEAAWMSAMWQEIRDDRERNSKG